MLRAIALTTAILAGLAAESRAADLEIAVTSTVPPTCQILLSVFDAADDWMHAPVASRSIAVSGAGAARAEIDLPAGRYAIAIVHDVNGNGVLDTGPLRIPREAFAFSNGARALLGPPSFHSAAFILPAEGAALLIPLKTAN